jgi:hypothetical protein
MIYSRALIGPKTRICHVASLKCDQCGVVLFTPSMTSGFELGTHQLPSELHIFRLRSIAQSNGWDYSAGKCNCEPVRDICPACTRQPQEIKTP